MNDIRHEQPLRERMIELNLCTATGGFVTKVLMPDFKTPPEVVFWGARVFVAASAGNYREVFSYQAHTREELGLKAVVR